MNKICKSIRTLKTTSNFNVYNSRVVHKLGYLVRKKDIQTMLKLVMSSKVTFSDQEYIRKLRRKTFGS